MQDFSLQELRILRKRGLLFAFVLIPAWLGLHQVLPAPVVEAALIFGVFYVLSGYRPLVETFRSVGRPYRLLSLAFVALPALGHLVPGDTWTFPLVGWHMYGALRPTTALVFYYYVGTRRSRQSVRLDLRRVLPPSVAMINYEIVEQIKAIESAATPERRVRRMAEHEATFKALARLVDRNNCQDPILTVSVFKCMASVADIKAYKGESAIACQRLWEIDVAG
jgi:hypothetical protein